MSASTANGSDQGEARFKWKTLALWSLTFALVSLTALAVVATITKADALSVVALALAVLAFVVQIIVFIVQGNAASQQAADTAALNGQTLRALATIEEKSEGTRETVVKMNDRLFEFAFTKARLELDASGSTEPAESVTGRVIERAKEIIHSNENVTIGEVRNRIQEQGRPNQAEPAVRAAPTVPTMSFLSKPPTPEEVEEVANALQALPTSKTVLPLVALYRLGQDLVKAEEAGRPQQAGMSSINAANELYDQGLVKRVQPTWTASPLYVLTEKGRRVARALLITPAPRNEAIVNARRQIEDFENLLERNRLAAKQKEHSIPLEN